jgi:hypothetical protein
VIHLDDLHWEPGGYGIARDKAVRNKLVMEAADTYWRKRPSVRRAVFKVIPDESTRFAALKRGEVGAVEEAGLAEERPLVAAVFRNRLRIRMGLQADPTVIYALQRAGRWDGNIRRQDLQIDSPYNTYRYPGLPPGPIAAPGRASIEATLNPADVPYLYFVSRNDGSHVFSRTYAEHQRNVQEYQVLYFRRLREQQALERAGGNQ